MIKTCMTAATLLMISTSVFATDTKLNIQPANTGTTDGAVAQNQINNQPNTSEQPAAGKHSDDDHRGRGRHGDDSHRGHGKHGKHGEDKHSHSRGKKGKHKDHDHDEGKNRSRHDDDHHDSRGQRKHEESRDQDSDD